MKRRHPDYSNCERCDYFYADCGDITGTNVYCHYDIGIDCDEDEDECYIPPCQYEITVER